MAVEELLRNKVDTYLFSETKLDETFPNQQLRIHGHKRYRSDRNKHSGRIMFYNNESIPCKAVNLKGALDECKIIFNEFSIKILKWLCIGLYKLPSQNDKYFHDNLSLILSKLTCKFDGRF